MKKGPNALAKFRRMPACAATENVAPREYTTQTVDDARHTMDDGRRTQHNHNSSL